MNVLLLYLYILLYLFVSCWSSDSVQLWTKTAQRGKNGQNKSREQEVVYFILTHINVVFLHLWTSAVNLNLPLNNEWFENAVIKKEKSTCSHQSARPKNQQRFFFVFVWESRGPSWFRHADGFYSDFICCSSRERRTRPSTGASSQRYEEERSKKTLCCPHRAVPSIVHMIWILTM